MVSKGRGDSLSKGIGGDIGDAMRHGMRHRLSGIAARALFAQQHGAGHHLLLHAACYFQPVLGQNRARRHLDEEIVTFFNRRLQRLLPPNRIAYIAPPIGGTQAAAVQLLADYRGDEGDHF